jgi:hypothetical protein
MSDDLNDFLRQAAARREARKRAESQAGGQKPSQPKTPPTVSRQATPASPATQSSRPAVLTSHPDSMESGIDKADRQREAHRKEVFGQANAPFQRTPPNVGKPKGNKQPQSNKQKRSNSAAPTPVATSAAPFVTSEQPDSETSAARAGSSSNELLKLLRNPQTLKTAFIASEIFGRKFD